MTDSLFPALNSRGDPVETSDDDDRELRRSLPSIPGATRLKLVEPRPGLGAFAGACPQFPGRPG